MSKSQTDLQFDAINAEVFRAELEYQRNKAEIEVNEEVIQELSGNDSKIKYSKKLEYRNSDLAYQNKVLKQLVKNLKKLR